MIVYKSAMVESLDDFFGGRPAWCEWAARRNRRAAQEHALELLKNTQHTLPDVVRQLTGDKIRPKDVGTAADLDAWLKKPGRGDATAGEATMRRGYTEALELASDGARPIETFWVAGVGADALEIQLCDSDRQVTVLVLLPDDRDDGYGSYRAQSKCFTLRASELTQHSGPKAASAG